MLATEERGLIGSPTRPWLARPTPHSTAYKLSFSSFAARKAIFLLALILIASPVAGFRPILAGNARTCRMPRPVRRILSPFELQAVSCDCDTL